MGLLQTSVCQFLCKIHLRRSTPHPSDCLQQWHPVAWSLLFVDLSPQWAETSCDSLLASCHMGDAATPVLKAHLPWSLQHLGPSAPQPWWCSACSGPALALRNIQGQVPWLRSGSALGGCMGRRRAPAHPHNSWAPGCLCPPSPHVSSL